jgi:ABC-type dipeptide/oligopeptide/nickel transport system permease subunit
MAVEGGALVAAPGSASRRGRSRRLVRAFGIEGACAAAVLAAVALAALFGTHLWHGNAYTVDFGSKLQGWSAPHPLGTDQFGRDILARLLGGARDTLGGALLVLALTTLGGLALGALAALAGGLLDALISRTLDTLLALPSLVVALALVGVFGPSFRGLLIALAIAGVPWYGRVYRSLVLTERANLYVEAALAAGATRRRVFLREIVPNIAGPALVVATVNLGQVILNLAALSFLGLGARPPAAEWGTMINDARPFFQTHPNLVLAPGAAIALTVVSINVLGDALRDLLDPRS